MRPTPLGRFVVWLETAGYSRCLDDRDLSGKEYRIDREARLTTPDAAASLTLEGSQGTFELYFNERGQLVGHDVLGPS
jgi:hypothetical protein